MDGQAFRDQTAFGQACYAEAQPSAPSCHPGAARFPDATPAADERVWRLAEAFGREPELISACLEGTESASPGWPGLILEAARMALRAHPDYADLHYHASRAALAAGEHDLAAKLLEAALRINPAYKDAMLAAARVALARGQPRQARGYLQNALSQGADYPDLHVLLGRAWSAEADWDQARRSYQRALELNAGLAEARELLAALPSSHTSSPTGVRASESGGKSDELSA